MEQLIILLVVALGSAISGYLQNKKKREAEQRGERPAPRGQAPIPQWPATPRDWQEELRRMLQGETAPPGTPPTAKPLPATKAPPVVRTPVTRASPSKPMKTQPERSEGDVVFASPLKQSGKAYSYASQLAGRVESRLEAIDAQTKAHKPATVARRAIRPNALALRRWTQNRESLRQAFLASLIFSPPVALRKTE